MSEHDFAHPDAQKKPAIPRFHVQAVEMTFKSQQAGRPVFEDREFVEIIIPGDRRSQVNEPVNDEHKLRWPVQYEAFKRGQELPREGTPLRNWPNSMMTPARIEELAYFHIQTVEELAAVNDAQLQNLGMGARQMRENAKTFLEVAAKGTAPLERLIAKVESQALENERLARELIVVTERCAALQARLDQGAAHAG